MDTKHSTTQWQRVVLLAVLGYEAAGCLAGGFMLVSAPDGSLMDMPVQIMHGTFSNFLIPGMVLFALGLLTTVAFFAVLRKWPYNWVWAGVALMGLLTWFWVEIAILLQLHWLHAMWGLPVVAGLIAVGFLIPSRWFVQWLLLSCGVFATLVYMAANLIAAANWPAYNVLSQTISELSAVGAPTRTLWVILTAPYTLLITGFAIGMLKEGEYNKNLRIAGRLLLVYAALGLVWPFAPMHSRGALAADEGTVTDYFHIACGIITALLYLVITGFGINALGKGFKFLSLLVLTILLASNMAIYQGAKALAAGARTPYLGLWERINIGAFHAWLIALAVVLIMKHQKSLKWLSIDATWKVLSKNTLKPVK